MFKDNNFYFPNIEQIKKNKKKSKSINKRNISHNQIPTKKHGFYAFSNTQYNAYEFISFYTPKNKKNSNSNIALRKRNSKNENSSNIGMNIKINMKRKMQKKENSLLSNINYNKLEYLQNKENIYIGNIIRNFNNKNENILLKKKKTKSLENKKGVLKKIKDIDLNKLVLDKKENNLLLNKKLNFKNEYLNDKKNILNQKFKNDNHKNIEIIREKILLEKNINNTKINNPDDIDKTNKIQNNNLNNDEKLNKEKINENNIYNDNKDEKKENIKNEKEVENLINNKDKENKKNENEISILKLNSDKKEKEKEKENIPILKLDNDSDSSSSSEQRSNKSGSDSEESDYSDSYESYDGLEVKGEVLTKNKKTNFLNNIKKCLFNESRNIKNVSKDYNTNSNTNIKIEDEDLKLETSMELKRKKTVDFSKTYRISLKENISFSVSQMNDSNIKILSSMVTQPGINDNKEKINQDSYLILENLFGLKFNIYGIFDGHGDNGHLISNLVSTLLNKYFTNKINYCIKNKNESKEISESESSIFKDEVNITDEMLSEIFSEKNNFIKDTIRILDEKSNECNFDLNFSGTTCVLLFILENKIVCSNIGDSSCYLFHCSNEERWTHELISILHKPEDPNEQKRIIENGGVIHPYYDEDGVFEGPDRVYVKGKTYPGLSLTRSIGDLEGEKVGIISEPDIIAKKIDSTCKYLVLGSDGLWDMIKPYDVIRIVNPFFNKGDPKGACNALLKRANKNWDKDESERDDITIIVVFIGTPNKINS